MRSFDRSGFFNFSFPISALFAVSRLLILPAEIYVVFECHSLHLPKNNLQNTKFIVDNSPNNNYNNNKFGDSELTIK